MNSHRGSGRYMHPTLAKDLAETVALHLGKPAECCLKFERGLRRDTQRGPRVLFTLTDDRKLWVDPPVADKIEATVAAGETFWICKRKAPGNSQREVYDVWTGGRHRGQPAAQGEMGPHESRLEADASDVMRQMARTLDALERKKQQQQSPPAEAGADWENNFRDEEEPAQPRTVATVSDPPLHPAWETVIRHSKDAIDALAAIRKHAEQYGRLIEPEDARSLLCTIIIGRQQRGGAR
jgi:hypothetical protein